MTTVGQFHDTDALEVDLKGSGQVDEDPQPAAVDMKAGPGECAMIVVPAGGSTGVYTVALHDSDNNSDFNYLGEVRVTDSPTTNLRLETRVNRRYVKAVFDTISGTPVTPTKVTLRPRLSEYDSGPLLAQ